MAIQLCAARRLHIRVQPPPTTTTTTTTTLSLLFECTSGILSQSLADPSIELVHYSGGMCASIGRLGRGIRVCVYTLREKKKGTVCSLMIRRAAL